MLLPACFFYVAHASSEGVCGYSLLRVRTFEAASAHSQARDCALSAPRVRAHFSPPPHIPAGASAGAAVARIRFTVPREPGEGLFIPSIILNHMLPAAGNQHFDGKVRHFLQNGKAFQFTFCLQIIYILYRPTLSMALAFIFSTSTDGTFTSLVKIILCH